MKKLVTILIALNCVGANADERYAYEYSSDHHNERHNDDWHEETERYERHSFKQPRHQQNYQQQPTYQIYMQPNRNYYPQDKQTREDNRWRQRREELEQMPQTPYYENQFYRDDTHW